MAQTVPINPLHVSKYTGLACGRRVSSDPNQGGTFPSESLGQDLARLGRDAPACHRHVDGIQRKEFVGNAEIALMLGGKGINAGAQR